MLRRFVLAALAVGLVVGLTPATGLARTSDSYTELQRQIAQTQAKIRDARKREARIMGELAASDQRRQSLERSLATVTDQLTLASRRLDLLQAQADQAALQLEAKNNE